jgi:hypothetical protein
MSGRCKVTAEVNGEFRVCRDEPKGHSGDHRDGKVTFPPRYRLEMEGMGFW